MSAETPRQYMLRELASTLPSGYVFIQFGDEPDTIQKPTAILSIREVQPQAGVPRGAYSTEWILTLAEPKTFGKSAEDALDNRLFEIIDAIRNIPNVVFDRAERVAVTQSNPGFDIHLTSTTRT